MPDQATKATQSTPSHSLPALSLAALGVVFGDIGTSPLYSLKAVLEVTIENPPTEILGALSLIVWTLIIITSVKYITLAMRVDNNGEGGILALMALLRMRHVQQPLVVFIGLFGAALIPGTTSAACLALACSWRAYPGTFRQSCSGISDTSDRCTNQP